MSGRGPKIRGDVLGYQRRHFIYLLLGRPWIHRNSIIPSTLHQVMKYVDGDEKVRTLIAERHPFKGVESYFTDSLLYQDSLETDKNSQPEELDPGNEADVEPETEEECL